MLHSRLPANEMGSFVHGYNSPDKNVPLFYLKGHVSYLKKASFPIKKEAFDPKKTGCVYREMDDFLFRGVVGSCFLSEGRCKCNFPTSGQSERNSAWVP